MRVLLTAFKTNFIFFELLVLFTSVIAHIRVAGSKHHDANSTCDPEISNPQNLAYSSAHSPGYLANSPQGTPPSPNSAMHSLYPRAHQPPSAIPPTSPTLTPSENHPIKSVQSSSSSKCGTRPAPSLLPLPFNQPPLSVHGPFTKAPQKLLKPTHPLQYEYKQHPLVQTPKRKLPRGSEPQIHKPPPSLFVNPPPLKSLHSNHRTSVSPSMDRPPAAFFNSDMLFLHISHQEFTYSRNIDSDPYLLISLSSTILTIPSDFCKAKQPCPPIFGSSSKKFAINTGPLPHTSTSSRSIFGPRTTETTNTWFSFIAKISTTCQQMLLHNDLLIILKEVYP